LKELHTRFLYPFVFKRGKLTEPAASLRTQTFSPRSGEKLPLWEYAAPLGLYSEPQERYQDELLPHVVLHLFPGLDPDFREETSKGCGYLKLSPTAANRWFDGTRLVVGPRVFVADSQGPSSRVLFLAQVGIELFLSPQGIGVLSIPLTPEREGLSLDEALDFNYLLAQYRRNPVAQFRKPHPTDKGVQPTKLRAEQLARVSPPPAKDAPLVDRLGAYGGTFDLRELIDWILAPLGAFGMPPVAKDLDELVVYSVARFGPDVRFTDLDGRAPLGRFLAALAQGDEPRHVGAPAGPLAIPNALLNANHWTAVGLLGAAHLVIDQPAAAGEDGKSLAVAFNEQRLPIARDKYFIPYLVALLQRLALNRATLEAVEILTSARLAPAKDLQGLSQGLLEFAIAGHFTQVSRRHALHRFYQLAREGLDIPNAWEEVRRSISDIDAAYSALRLEEVAKDVQSNVETMKTVAREATALTQGMHSSLELMARAQGVIEEVAKDVQSNVQVMKTVAGETSELTKGMHSSLEFMAHAQAVVELVEIFLASVYAAHLTHMLAWEDDPFRGVYVAASAALGAVVTAYFATKKKSHMVWIAAVAGVLYLLTSTLIATTISPGHEEGARRAALSVREFHLPTGLALRAWESISAVALGVILLLCAIKLPRREPRRRTPKRTEVANP
jgi:hypothetical protein